MLEESSADTGFEQCLHPHLEIYESLDQLGNTVVQTREQSVLQNASQQIQRGAQ